MTDGTGNTIAYGEHAHGLFSKQRDAIGIVGVQRVAAAHHREVELALAAVLTPKTPRVLHNHDRHPRRF